MFSLTPRSAYKIVLLGDTSVGKSSIATQYVRGSFNNYEEPTIGAAFMCKNQDLMIDEKVVSCKFEIWDTAGQERYKSLAPMYYRGAHVALIVYDITSRESLDGATFWLRELAHKGPEDLCVILVGNKLDLDEKRKVFHDEVIKVVQDFECVHRCVSAKDSKQISELFEMVGREALHKFPTNQDPQERLRTTKCLSTSKTNQSLCC